MFTAGERETRRELGLYNCVHFFRYAVVIFSTKWYCRCVLQFEGHISRKSVDKVEYFQRTGNNEFIFIFCGIEQ